MATEAAGEEGCGGGSQWTTASNWIVGGGCIRDVISFDTYAKDAPAIRAISTPILLLRSGVLPCEITICFDEKCQMRKIYVRSTAKAYEIYTAADKQNYCKGYLCNLHCRIAAKEVVPLIATSVASADCESGNYATPEKKDKMSLSDSNRNSEDGWVEGKVPDSPLHDQKTNVLSRQAAGNSKKDFQIYYEATADISDASPCMSVTLRFLSLQARTYVHVSEIYIYADPVVTTEAGAPVDMGKRFGGSSHLAMFMPNPLPLFKSAENMQLGSSQNITEKEASPSTTVGEANARLKSGQSTYNGQSDLDQLSKSYAREKFVAVNHIERVLDELVLRVTRIEAFCSRFEGSLLKPVNNIEMRLQQLEELFHTYARRAQSPQRADVTGHLLLLVAGAMASVPDTRTRPGLVMRAPEFSIEDDEYLNYDASLASDSNSQVRLYYDGASAGVESGVNPSPVRVLSSGANRSTSTLSEVKGEITVGDSSMSASATSEIARNSDWDSGCDIYFGHFEGISSTSTIHQETVKNDFFASRCKVGRTIFEDSKAR
ncbi:hypothetical protein OPV22_027607 [Ensete ventricosum]|uniref:Uncharacterized protein n=1 Tax=Ensete ventricosum TaxID=4639 RepID=A0AAV8Q0B3_ENSVE|nr:hypothetical protein OPV22_027607 [Ensete ventricosum]